MASTVDDAAPFLDVTDPAFSVRSVGVRQARDIVALADARAESPLELITRLAMHDSKFPPPQLQVEIGGYAVDFLLPGKLIVEADGRGKYQGDALWREKKRESVLAVVRSSFKPEFLNRLDEVVLFDALTQDELTHIVDLQLALLEKRLAVRRIGIRVSEAAQTWLADVGYDPAYGARPLRRLIQSAIGDPLARLLIAGEVTDGGRVTVDVGEGDEAGGLVLR